MLTVPVVSQDREKNPEKRSQPLKSEKEALLIGKVTWAPFLNHNIACAGISGLETMSYCVRDKECHCDQIHLVNNTANESIVATLSISVKELDQWKWHNQCRGCRRVLIV